jgi:hypothetical protein
VAFFCVGLRTTSAAVAVVVIDPNAVIVSVAAVVAVAVFIVSVAVVSQVVVTVAVILSIAIVVVCTAVVAAAAAAAAAAVAVWRRAGNRKLFAVKLRCGLYFLFHFFLFHFFLFRFCVGIAHLTFNFICIRVVAIAAVTSTADVDVVTVADTTRGRGWTKC